MIDKDFLEIYAEDSLQRGINARREGRVEDARKLYASAYSVNRYLGRKEFLDLCHRLIMSTGFDEDNAKIFERRVFEGMKKVLDSVVKK